MTKELLDASLGKIVSAIVYDGTDFHLLRVDAAGHLQVDTVTSALPAGAATSANQLTEITALELIDDLRAALASVATDSLLVRNSTLENLVRIYQRGKIKTLFSEFLTATGNSGVVTITGAVVPASTIFVVTWMCAYCATGSTTCIEIYITLAGVPIYLILKASPVLLESILVTNDVVVGAGDRVGADFLGVGAGTLCVLNYTGYYIETV
jgi:hypothetical protein